MAADLTPTQQGFADLVLGGMPASRAYREAGYAVRTDAAAEACASRLLSLAKVAAYLAERRTKAADRAELNYAEFLKEIADFARDNNVDDAQRFAAYRFVTEQLAQFAPLATPVPEATGEGTVKRAARINIGILENIMAGRMPVEQGMRCLEVVDKAPKTIVSAQLVLADAGLNQGPPPAPPPQPRDPTVPPRSRPKWLKATPGPKDVTA